MDTVFKKGKNYSTSGRQPGHAGENQITEPSTPMEFRRAGKDGKANKRKNFGAFFMAVIVFIAWQLLSMVYPSLVLPSPAATFSSLIDINQNGLLLANTIATLKKLVIAQVLSIVTGSLLGMLMGANKRFGKAFEPVIYAIQAVPPILYMTLAMIWFGLNGRATIFIVFIGCAPVMAVTLKEGFDNIDQKLLEMGKAFKFTKSQMITDIVMPSLTPYFKSGLITVLSFSWKLAVMGEVLSASTGLGSQITDARNNLRTDMVFAWGIVIVLLCYLSQKLIAKLLDFKPARRKYYGK